MVVAFEISGTSLMVCSNAGNKTSAELKTEYMKFCDVEPDGTEEVRDWDKYEEFVMKYNCCV